MSFIIIIIILAINQPALKGVGKASPKEMDADQPLLWTVASEENWTTYTLAVERTDEGETRPDTSAARCDAVVWLELYTCAQIKWAYVCKSLTYEHCSVSLGTLFLSNLAEVIVVVDCSYLALFSALDQTHCALVVCGSKWVTIFFYSTFLNIHWHGVLAAIFCCYMAGACKTAAISAHSLCTPYNYASVYTVTSCNAKPHT